MYLLIDNSTLAEWYMLIGKFSTHALLGQTRPKQTTIHFSLGFKKD